MQHLRRQAKLRCRIEGFANSIISANQVCNEYSVKSILDLPKEDDFKRNGDKSLMIDDVFLSLQSIGKAEYYGSQCINLILAVSEAVITSHKAVLLIKRNTHNASILQINSGGKQLANLSNTISQLEILAIFVSEHMFTDSFPVLMSVREEWSRYLAVYFNKLVLDSNSDSITEQIIRFEMFLADKGTINALQ